MSQDYLFATPVLLTKGELLQLHALAGDMSISEYCKKVLREHIAIQSAETTSEIAAQQGVQSDVVPECDCNSAQGFHEKSCAQTIYYAALRR